MTLGELKEKYLPFMAKISVEVILDFPEFDVYNEPFELIDTDEFNNFTFPMMVFITHPVAYNHFGECNSIEEIIELCDEMSKDISSCLDI